jgi:hypothetical protein
MADLIENPYVGPRTFEEKDGPLFFGREGEARDLLWLTMSEPLVLFSSPSGAGKSSLINTRLLPGLRGEGFEVLPTCRVSGALPAGVSRVNNIFVFNMLLSLDQGREEAGRLTDTHLADYLSSFSAAGHEQPTRSREADGKRPRVLIIDQFEEIFTAHLDHWQQRSDFFRQLHQAVSCDPLLWVMLAMREDYVATLDPYARLLPDKLRARFYMQRMGYQAALEAVKKPAEDHGRPFASGVAEALVDNLRQIYVHGRDRPHLGEFVEPVQLQVVCYQLWENLKDCPPTEITHWDLRELGDVDTALAGFYEAAIGRAVSQTGVSEIELRDWFEHQLITEAGTRGMVYQGAEKTDDLPNRAVRLLADQFLLRAEMRAGGTWYELVHDRFVEPILQANRAWRLRQTGLVGSALAWEAAGRSEDNLYRRARLKAALADVQGQTLEPLVAEFLAASQAFDQALEEKEKQAQRQRELEQTQALAEAERRRAEEQARAARRLRRLALVLAAVFLVAVGAAIFAWSARQQALDQGRAALAAQGTAQAEANARATAQAQAEAEADARATAQAQADAGRAQAEAAQATAEAEARVRATAQAQAETDRALAETARADLETNLIAQLTAVPPVAALQKQLDQVWATQTAVARTPTPSPIPTAAPIPTATPTPTFTPQPSATPPPAYTPALQLTPSGVVFNDFESPTTWKRGDEPNGTFERSDAEKHSGDYAGRLAYTFPSSDNDYVVFLWRQALDGQPNQISAWVYGDASGHFLNVWIKDAAGQTWQFPFGQVKHTGWQPMTAFLEPAQPWPAGHISGPEDMNVDYPISFQALVLDDVPDTYSGSGTIYVDDLESARGAPLPTATPSPPIYFFADRTALNAGECAFLRWDVENVRAVYLDGGPVTGHETRQVCPKSTTTYTLRVVLTDGSAIDQTVTITVGGGG